jgi:signal transduction histidine kinase
MTLRKRLIFFFILLAVLILVIPNLVIGWAMRQHFLELAERESNEVIYRVQNFINYLSHEDPAIAVDLHQPAGSKKILDNLTAYLISKEGLEIESGFFLEIRDPLGEVVISSFNLGEHLLPNMTDRHSISELTLADGKTIPILLNSHILKIDNKEIGSLKVAVSLLENAYFFNKLLIFWLIGLILTFLAALGMATLFSRQALKPLARLSDAVEKMALTGTLEQLQLQKMPPDQIGKLAQTFNSLLSQIRQLLEKQQRFIADASHELRSPLTAIQGHAELLLKRGATHPEILSDGLLIIRQESERLGSLVDDLLLLARTLQTAPETQLLELNRLVQEVYEARQLLHANLKFSPAPNPIWILGEKSSLQRVMINLIDNALRFTPTEKPIEIQIYLEEMAIVEVRDQGPGIPSDKLPFIFERFYRLESDRNREQGGTGLGLPIVKDVLAWHGGKIEVKSQVQQGSCFKVILPLKKDSLNKI